MTTGIESGVGGVWQVRQSVAGTIERPDATAMRRLRKAGDDALGARKTSGSEPYVDGTTWGSPTGYITAVGGDIGQQVIQGQIEAIAFLYAQQFGVDTVTGSADPWTHTIPSGTPVPASNTLYQSMGQAVGPVQNSFYDCKIARSTLNCGQDQMVLHFTEQLMALFAAEWAGTMPTAADSGVDPLRWTEAVVRIDGTTMDEAYGDTVDADGKLDVHRGQKARPVCFIYGKGLITRTIQAIVTDVTLPKLLRGLYGTTTPADRTAIVETIVQMAVVTTWTRSASRVLTVTTPALEVDPRDWAFGPKAEGGRQEVAFGGECKAVGGPAITVVALTGDSRAYV
jgi:hypothetical protein